MRTLQLSHTVLATDMALGVQESMHASIAIFMPIAVMYLFNLQL